MKLTNIERFFKDKDGRIVLWQSPNVLLWGWIACTVFSLLVTHERIEFGLGHLGAAFLFAWAYMEITKGINYFRKLLGFLVLTTIVLSYFR